MRLFKKRISEPVDDGSVFDSCRVRRRDDGVERQAEIAFYGCGDTTYFASEECAIRKMDVNAKDLFAPRGGEPVIVTLKNKSGGLPMADLNCFAEDAR